MQNEEGQNMDLYIPRKWYLICFYDFLYYLLVHVGSLFVGCCCCCSSATNRLITSKDHASVQINVGHLDELGRYTGTFSTFALCGFVRAQVRPGSVLACWLVQAIMPMIVDNLIASSYLHSQISLRPVLSSYLHYGLMCHCPI